MYRYLILLVILVAPFQVSAYTCTPGVDCYCDMVLDDGNNTNNLDSSCASVADCDPSIATCYNVAAACDGTRTTNVPIDANLIECEGWEAPTISYVGTCVATPAQFCSTDSDCAGADTCDDSVWVGDGAPYYGPWWDISGAFTGPCHRGANNFITKKYGGIEGGYWEVGDPSATPDHGCSCDNANTHCEGGPWSPGNVFESNSGISANIPLMFFPKAGEFNNEVATLGEPINAAGGGTGPFDGVTSLGLRIPAGEQSEVLGNKTFNEVSEIGVTYAVAYPNNLVTSGVTGSNWKNLAFWKDAFQPGGTNAEPWPLGASRGTINPSGDTLTDSFPFTTRKFAAPGMTLQQCQDAMNAATLTGSCFCDPFDLGRIDCTAAVGPNELYDFQDDWGFEEWGCVRAEQSGMGTTNYNMTIWFNDEIVFQLLGFDGTLLLADAYDQFDINAYANANQGLAPPPFETPTTETSYRFEDNLHVTNGPAVSCAQIGLGEPAFSATLTPNPPSGFAPLTGVVHSATANAGTGPNYCYTLDCVQGSGADTNATWASSSTFAFPSTTCDGDYNAAATYVAEVTIDDVGSDTDCAGTPAPLATVTGTSTVIVNPSADPLIAVLSRLPTTGPAPLNDVVYSASAVDGTGPNFCYTLDCVQGSGIDTGPTFSTSSGFVFPTTVCNGDYAVANTVYTAELTIDDVGTDTDCLGTPLDTDTDSIIVTTTGCTEGVDCFCDTLSITAGTLELCDDYEDPGYYNPSDPNNWAAGTGGDRGGDSAWENLYGIPGTGDWDVNTPVIPTIENQCTLNAPCGGGCDYRLDDQFQCSETDIGSAIIDSQNISEVDDELGSLTLNETDAANRYIGFRSPTGTCAEPWSGVSLGTATEYGIVERIAYSTNLPDIHGGQPIPECSWDGDFVPRPWDHSQWDGNNGFSSNLFMGNDSVAGLAGGAPFQIKIPTQVTQAVCSSSINSSTVIKGQWACSSDNPSILGINADASFFDRSDDWPLGQWGCHRGHIKGLGTSDGEYHIYFDAGGGEFTLFSATQIDWATLIAATELTEYRPNHHYDGGSASCEPAGPCATVEPFFRYHDDTVVVSGAAPPTCLDIGFEAGPGPPPPVPPINFPGGSKGGGIGAVSFGAFGLMEI